MQKKKKKKIVSEKVIVNGFETTKKSYVHQ
jgi:hypothetical protein